MTGTGSSPSALRRVTATWSLTTNGWPLLTSPSALARHDGLSAVIPAASRAGSRSRTVRLRHARPGEMAFVDVVRTHYPCEGATPASLRALADEYRRAAELVATLGSRGDPLSWSSYRLLALQAVEFYLNAFLLDRGRCAAELRGLQHDLAARARLATATGLSLRRRTRLHVEVLCERREYLVSRYAPERASATSQLNRMAATLEDVATKTRVAGGSFRGGGRPSGRTALAP